VSSCWDQKVLLPMYPSPSRDRINAHAHMNQERQCGHKA
jgi:hypothetical protein